MELAATAILPGQGYQAPASVTATTAPTGLAETPAPVLVDGTLPTKFVDASASAIEDEDLFLGDDEDGADIDDNDRVDEDVLLEDENDDDDGDDNDDDDNGDDGDDDDYFSSTYRPLSNLPTPPQSSSQTSSFVHSPQVDHGGDGLESSLLGPAVHLVNMLPPAASLATPSVPLVQAMLTRAQLPLDTVALAVCILDSLDSRFARTWRLTCPLGAPAVPSSSASSPPSLSLSPSSYLSPSFSSSSPSAPPMSISEKRHTLPSPLSPSFPDVAAGLPTVDHRLLHIDAVFPEVIILAALVIAAKFTDDGYVSQQPAHAYCAAWGSATTTTTADGPFGAAGAAGTPGPYALWTGAQLSATERCIMQNLSYRILPLLDADLLADAQADMRRAGAQALRTHRMRAAAAAEREAAANVVAVAAAFKTNLAIMTPPEEEALVDGAVPPSSSSNAIGLGLLQLAPSAVNGAVGGLDSMPLTLPAKAQRRYHVSSRSECIGRFAAYER